MIFALFCSCGNLSLFTKEIDLVVNCKAEMLFFAIQLNINPRNDCILTLV